MMRNARKYIIAVIVIVLGITFLDPETYAADRANIAVEPDSLYTITNKEKERLLFDYAAAGDLFTGSMKTYFQADSLGDNDKRWSVFHDEFTGIEYWGDRSGVVVNDSDEFKFTYVPTEEDIENEDFGMGLSILMTSKKHPYVYVGTARSEEIIVGKRSIKVMTYEGYDGHYSIDYRKSKKGINYAVEGYTDDKFIFKKEKNGASIEGAVGKTLIKIFDPPESYPKNYVSGTYYFFGNKVKFRTKNGKLIVSGGIKLTSKKRSKFTNVLLRTVNKGKDMFMTWNRVKGASCII